MKTLVGVVLFSLVLFGCVATIGVEEVSFLTDDGVRIFGDYYASNSSRALVLMPMLNHDRNSYGDFALKAQAMGFKVLAIDLRGHGKSVEKDGKGISWQAFSEKDFNAMVLDSKAAKKFLESKGAKSIAMVGASIGANTALAYGSIDPSVKAVVLLSPGLDYRGLKTSEAAKTYRGKLLIAASSEDEYSFQSSRELYELSQAEKVLKELEDAGHGTQMFSKPGFEPEVLDWLVRTSSSP